MDEYLGLLLAGMLTFVFGWNNSAILIGNERGSGTLSAREATILCSVGIVLGVVLEGTKMTKSLGGTIGGPTTDTIVLATLVISIVFTLALTLAGLPVSFSNTMVGAFAGAALASSIPLNSDRLVTIVGFWVIAPLATMAATFLIYRVVGRATANSSIVSVDSANRAGVGLVSLALAYVLGANNIGLIYGTAFGATSASTGGPLPIVLTLAAVAIVAVAFFGRGGVAGTVGDRLLVLSPQGVLAAFTGTILVMWVATQLSIPISVSQCLIGGMFGAALTKKIAIINGRISWEIVSSWMVVPVVAFVLAALLTPLI
jgi:phosphate/sulfate permease